MRGVVGRNAVGGVGVEIVLLEAMVVVRVWVAEGVGVGVSGWSRGCVE